MSQHFSLPDVLPVPADDGGSDHLLGLQLPDLALASTQGGEIRLSDLKGLTVLYCYPMTGRPDVALPDGWDQIPGARGCTPQSCAFRDHHAELAALNTKVYGISTQSSTYQQEAVERLHLPFSLLSDERLALLTALKLPSMDVEGKTLIKRTTLICRGTEIINVFYPVFPPDQNAEQVIAWLQAA
jgi:peroxiredoxin